MNCKFILEISVESTGAALAAERGGADRIELCAELRNGGITPSSELMSEARTAVRLPIHAIIRPRAGNFVYTGEEFDEMKGSISLSRELKMDGVVFGILQKDNSIDVQRTKELVEFASPMQVTFHRAFDERIGCDPGKDDSGHLFKSLEDVIATGSSRILTSGGAPHLLEGLHALQFLLRRAGNRIVVMPGGGIQPANFTEIQSALGATEYHSGLGTVLPYGAEDFPAFEAAVRSLRNSTIR